MVTIETQLSEVQLETNLQHALYYLKIIREQAAKVWQSLYDIFGNTLPLVNFQEELCAAQIILEKIGAYHQFMQQFSGSLREAMVQPFLHLDGSEA
ncbi:hypothetical protein cyc_06952 [Cyclospora cayetanensis]|uniref:Uncharacterized protein n=1 Tax=Cyclospora cayetanensis TaxID=88456 RepID=A0A1D3D050_9EIME|nr:hypothetical protein cyc_06952 [Cyclospora cayetanensis]